MELRELTTDGRIYIDVNEDYAVRDRAEFAVARLPCDIAWRAQDGQVIGIEVKRSGDLMTSWLSRRLQRQVRALIEQVDVPVLGLRLSHSPILGYDLYQFDSEILDLVLDLAAWSVGFGAIVFIPPNDVPDYLLMLRARLDSESGRRRILAGSDHRPVRDGSPCTNALQNLGLGVGPVIASRLEQAFGGDIVAILTAPDEELVRAGAHRGIVRRIKELRSYRSQDDGA